MGQIWRRLLEATLHTGDLNDKRGEKRKNTFWIWLLILALIPAILAGLYVVTMQIQSLFRYEPAYFAQEFQRTYNAPGTVARALEGVLQEGDESRYRELTGLSRTPAEMLPHPELQLSILLDVDERGYFHYLYFDFDTYKRHTHYIKELRGRWITVPQDAYFYYDSGQWLRVFLPIALSWWLLMCAVAIIKLLSLLGLRTRSAFGW